MIIPLGHEQRSVRRQPWVTWIIMALCLVVFLFTGPGDKERARESLERLQVAVEYFVEHPYLEPPPRLREIFVSQIGEEETDAQIELMREVAPDGPTSNLELEREQAKLDRLVEESVITIDDAPLRRWGLVPAEFRLPTILTYQFLHGGWMHLLGNLFMLFLVGPFIEDVWGRPLYFGFYLTAGAVAGLMFMVRYPALDSPLIGASGAIAGVMGAFLVRYWHTKIKFLYWFFLLVGTFEAPAWLMLPLWFFKELFSAQAMDSLAPGTGGGSVAFWAHVWGFVFGVIVAYAITHFQIEERHIHSRIESKITLVDNTAVEAAAQLAEKGDARGAVAVLQEELATNSDNVEAATAMWNLCFKTQQAEVALPYMLSALHRTTRKGDDEFVIAIWEDVLHACDSIPIEPALGVRLAEILVEDGRDGGALDTLALAWGRVDGSTPAPILLRMARLAMALYAPETAAVIDAALAHPEFPSEMRSELEAARTAVADEPEEEASSTAAVAYTADEFRHTLQVITAIPHGFDGDQLKIEVDGRLRYLGLGGIQVLAAAGITRDGRRPVVLIDLLLDPPWGGSDNLRSIRLTSDTFDPRKLVGGEDAMTAFQRFLDRILTVSEAVPLPDPQAARGQPFRSFGSLEEYQREVLNVTS